MDADVRLEVLLTEWRAPGPCGACQPRRRAGRRRQRGRDRRREPGAIVQRGRRDRALAARHARRGVRPGHRARPSVSSAFRIPATSAASFAPRHALGGTGVLALDGTAHPAGWKAVRGSMGSLFRVPVGVGTLAAAVAAARSAALRIIATVADDADAIDQRRSHDAVARAARQRGRRPLGRGRRVGRPVQAADHRSASPTAPAREAAPLVAKRRQRWRRRHRRDRSRRRRRRRSR